MIRPIMMLLLSVSIISFGQAQELTFADYAKLPDLSMVVISPSGKRLAYRKVQDGKDMLLVIDLDAQKVIEGVNISSMNPDNIYFIDDDRLILVASKNSRLYGFRGRHDMSVAFSYNLKNGKIFQLLTAGDYIYGGQSQVGNIIGVSPDKRYAYMPAWKSKGEYSLYKVDLTKRRRPIVYKKGTFDTVDFFVDKQGKVLARERFNNKSNLHSLEALHDGAWVRIFSEKTEIPKVSFNGVTADGTKLVMIRQDDSHGRWAYHTISLNDGTLSKPLFSREDRDVETVLTDINRVVFGVRYSGFKPSYEFFDDKLNRRMAGIDAVLPDNAMRIDSYTPDWENIIFYLTGTNSSGEYYRYKKGGLDLLARARATITPDKVHPVKIISYKARDGLNIPALITLPLHHKAQNLPAIVLPHGGPESYDKLNFDWLAQYFASQGYLVIQPQFRGSKGFGNSHLFKGRGKCKMT